MSALRTIALADILPEVHAELPGCPAAIIKRECRKVLKDFCVNTKTWAVTLDPISLIPNEAEYELEGWSPREATIDSVLQVTHSGNLLMPIRDYVMASRGVIRLTRTPTQRKADALVVVVSLKPCTTATTFKCQCFCEMWDHNIEAIAAGTLHLCLSMNGVAWYNIGQAALEQKRYKDLRVAERIRVQKGGTNGILYMKPRTPFLRTFNRTNRRNFA